MNLKIIFQEYNPSKAHFPCRSKKAESSTKHYQDAIPRHCKSFKQELEKLQKQQITVPVGVGKSSE